jgi:hypothetical protein
MSNRKLVSLPPQIVCVRRHATPSPAASIFEFVRSRPRRFAAWLRDRRERQKLSEYLASDHRMASDIGYPHRLP